MANMKGIDISAYQSNVDFSEVVAAGIEVAYIKATEGTNYVNPDLQSQYQGAKAAGIKVGFYHYIHPVGTADSVAEAQYFVNAIKGMDFDCRPVLDLEINSGIEPSELSAVAVAFLNEVEAITGVVPVVYTYLGFISENLTNVLASYPLWIADYTSGSPGSNSIWGSSWAGWQYSDTGTASGVTGDVDLDEFTSDILATAVIIDAGSAILFGQLIGGSTWGPIATICKAKGITYTWDATKDIMCLAGASDANIAASGVQVVAGGQVIAGQLLGGSTWAPVAAICKALGISYTWDATTRTMKF